MYCTKCGNKFIGDARFCVSCGSPRGGVVRNHRQVEEELHYVLPVGVPGAAIAAGYLGLISVLIAPAPFALVLGIVGLRQIRKGEHKYGKLRCWTGIVLGGIFTGLLLFIIGAMIFAPET